MTRPEQLVFERERWVPGEQSWFEYHCWESDASADAPAWHHSHQRVTIVHEADSDAPPDSTAAERAELGLPRLYTVRFGDGLTWDVFEDELLSDPAGYTRPAPPA